MDDLNGLTYYKNLSEIHYKKLQQYLTEIEKLKAENNQLVYELDKSRDSHMKIITKLTRQRDIMKKCAEFYADKDNWVNVNRSNRYFLARTDSDSVQHHTAEGPVDIAGATARKALQEAEGME